MSNNRYGGVDSYAAFFIAYKARTLIRMPMFTVDDYEDIQQELMLAYLLAEPQFDCNHGDKRSFIKTVVNNKAIDIVRKAEFPMRWSGSANLSLDMPMSEDGCSLLDMLDSTQSLWGTPFFLDSQYAWESRHDFQSLFLKMPKDLQELCVLLSQHKPKEIIDLLRIPASTLYSRIERLRKFIKENE